MGRTRRDEETIILSNTLRLGRRDGRGGWTEIRMFPQTQHAEVRSFFPDGQDAEKPWGGSIEELLGLLQRIRNAK